MADGRGDPRDGPPRLRHVHPRLHAPPARPNVPVALCTSRRNRAAASSLERNVDDLGHDLEASRRRAASVELAASTLERNGHRLDRTFRLPLKTSARSAAARCS